MTEQAADFLNEGLGGDDPVTDQPNGTPGEPEGGAEPKPEGQPEEPGSREEPEDGGGAEPEPKKEVTRVPLSELLDERSKRQAAAEEAQRLKAENEQLRAGKGADPQQPNADDFPDPVDDPEGFKQAMKGMREEIRNELRNEAMQEKVADSRERMLARDGVRELLEIGENGESAVLTKMFEENPALQAQALQKADPYAWLESQAKAWKERQDMGDPAAYKEKIKAELKDELRKELAEEMKAENQQKAKDALANQPKPGANAASAKTVRETDAPSSDPKSTKDFLLDDD